MYANEMIPSDSERNKFRRSSILKPRKPRQPLQNVNFDSSSDENSPVPSKIKRRVSFAEKKHVKEFCHSTEQGTVWDNTYEEHDSSLKGSSVTDQNGEIESKENASLHNSNNSCVNKCINFESNSMSTHVIDDQISQKYVAIANEEDDTNYNLDFTNPISTDLSNVFQVENTALPSRFEDKISSISVTYNDKNEEHIELLDEKSYRQTVITNASHISKNIKPNNIIIYKDSDEEDYTNKVAKNYSELCPNNTSKLNETHIQDLSMELTTPISFLISANSHIEKQKTQKDDIINNIDTNYTSNYNNISMEITEAVPMSTMSVTSDLRIFKQIPMISQNCEETNGNVANNDHNVFSTAFNLQSDIVSKDIVSEQIQNCEDTKGDVANNDHNIFSTAFNLQSDIVSIDIISEQIQNVNCANDSMILTSVIQSSRDVIGTDTCHTNNVIVNNLMKATSISPKIYEKNTCNENVVKGNDLRKDQTDKTEIFNDIQMEMTVPVNTILSSNIYNKKNLKVDEPIFTNDKTTFLNLSMEMTKAVSTKSRQEITDTITCESLSKENIHSEKDKGTICLNEETRILHKSMEFTEVVSNSPHREEIFNIIHTTPSSEKLPKTYLSAEKSTSTTFQTDADTRISDSNLRDSLNEINRCSFLRKSLENNLVELQSITPPSFECPDSEEENSSHQVQSEFQLPVVTDVSINNISDRLIINNVTESKYPIDSRKSVANDYFTNLTEKEESINNQTEDCYKKIIVDKIEDNQKVDCQETAKTIIDDNQLNESNCYITENKEMNEESILLTNTKNEEIMTMENINLNCTSLISTEIKVIDEDQINEREYTSKKVNKDTKLQDNIKIKRQYLNVEKKQEIDECDDHLNRTETVIKHQIKCKKKKENLNEVKLHSAEEKDKCLTEKLVAEQYTSTNEEESLTEQDPFLILSQKLEMHAIREDCIWNVHFKNFDKKIIVFGFMSNSLLVIIYLSSYDRNDLEENLIKEIKLISLVADDAGILIRIVHKLILEKINAKTLTNLYKTQEDILPMLNFISQDVKLAMDFMFDLRCLDNLNLMDISYDKISFTCRSKQMDIILRITIKVKRFDKLISDDISVQCLLGKIKETDVKNLIKNIRKDHKFLRRYINDVKDYIDIMEEIFK